MPTVRSGDRTDGLRIHSWRSLLGSRSIPSRPADPPPSPAPGPPSAVVRPPAPVVRPVAGPPQYQAAGWNALGSEVNLFVVDGERLAHADSLSRQLLDDIDRTTSTNRPDGDLARANQAAGRWVRVDPLLIRMVAAAVRVAKGTAGMVNPAVRRAGASVSGTSVSGAWEQIEVDPDGGLKVPAGAHLDLGSMGKAFAADSIAKKVSQDAGTSLLVCIGSDVAVGNLPDEEHRWRITVNERPEHPARYAAVEVVLGGGALSTSPGTAPRSPSWAESSAARGTARTLPRGLPVAPVWRTASVCAASCVDARAASTAAVALGEQAPAWLWQRSLAARLVTPGGEILRIAGWPEN